MIVYNSFKNEWKKVRIDPETGKATQLKAGTGYPEEVITRSKRSVNLLIKQINHEFKVRSEDEASLRIFNTHRNSELVYKFLLGVPYEQAVAEKVPCYIPFESKYYLNYLQEGVFREKNSPKQASSRSKSKEKNSRASIASKSVTKVPKKPLKAEETSKNTDSKSRRVSVGSISRPSSRQNLDYKAYRDRHDAEKSPFPSIQPSSIDRQAPEYEEAKSICHKIQEKLQKEPKFKLIYDRSGGQFREISNLNYLNYERESSKEYARKKDTQKFKAHRDDLAHQFERVFEERRS